MSGLDPIRVAAPPLRALADPTGGTQPPSPDLSLSDTFAALAGQTIDDVKFYARAVETHENAAPEALHQLRVSLRRLRALWWALQPLLEKHQCRIERDKFKQLADAAGETRNWDILRELVPTSTPGRSRRLALTKAVDGQRALAASASREAIGRGDIEGLLDRTLKNCLEQLAARDYLPTLAKYAQKRVSRVARNLRKAGRRATRDVKAEYASLHKVRISAKKLRYLTEFFSPSLGGRQDVALERLGGLQEALGELNDIVVSEALVAQHSVELGSRKRVRKVIRGLDKKKKQKMRRARVVLRGTLKALHQLATAASQ